MKRDAAFYFANLGADISRCIAAAREGNDTLYTESLDRAYRTLSFITDRSEAYEEGLLMLRGLEYARADDKLSEFNESVDELIAQYSPLLQ